MERQPGHRSKFQENRTLDNLFHGLPNAEIPNGGFDSNGQYVPLQPVSLRATYDLHSFGCRDRTLHCSANLICAPIGQ